MRKIRQAAVRDEDSMGELTWAMVWVWAVVGALSVILTAGCGSPTGPDSDNASSFRTYPAGTYVVCTSGVQCSSEIVVRAEGDGFECAWCAGEVLVCGRPAVTVTPWDGTDEGWPGGERCSR